MVDRDYEPDGVEDMGLVAGAVADMGFAGDEVEGTGYATAVVEAVEDSRLLAILGPPEDTGRVERRKERLQVAGSHILLAAEAEGTGHPAVDNCVADRTSSQWLESQDGLCGLRKVSVKQTRRPVRSFVESGRVFIEYICSRNATNQCRARQKGSPCTKLIIQSSCLECAS